MFTEKYRIATDSAGDLYPGGLISSVPMKIRSQVREYVDDNELDVAAMVGELRSTPGRTFTSCPNIQEWLDAFGEAQYVFAVTITSHLSGSWEAAMHAKRDYEEAHPGAKVHVIDSLSTGPEMALLMDRLTADIEAGMEFAAIVADITAYQARTHLLFILQSVQNLARNGRVHPALAKIVGVLNIRILGRASSEGELETLHKVRGDKGAIKKLWEELLEHGYKGGRIRIHHCLNESAAAAIREAVLAAFPGAPLILAPCRGLDSYYAEQGGVLVGFESAE